MFTSIALLTLAAATVNGLGDGFNKRQADCASLSAPLVPLHASYGQGAIPSSLQTCAVGALGNTFMNGMYEGNSTTETGDVAFASCFGCVFTIVQELPCVYKAITNHDPSELLKCGIGKPQICDCLSCLPSPVQPFVQAFCASTADNAPVTTELVDPNFSASTDPKVKGFLGTLTLGDLPALISANDASTPNTPLLGGALSSSCGCSNVCVGFCVLGNCVGGCV